MKHLFFILLNVCGDLFSRRAISRLRRLLTGDRTLSNNHPPFSSFYHLEFFSPSRPTPLSEWERLFPVLGRALPIRRLLPMMLPVLFPTPYPCVNVGLFFFLMHHSPRRQNKLRIHGSSRPRSTRQTSPFPPPPCITGLLSPRPPFDLFTLACHLL